MPPIRGQKAQKSVEPEGRILLAIKAIKNRRFTSVAAAARSFEVPRSTLQDRMKGITRWSDTRAIGHKFTQLEEESIQDWLISMDHRGAAKHWALNVSPNGWTSNEIGVDWLQKHFIPHVKSQKKGKHCLLVLDGHHSHLTATFDKICQENNIIPICMPPHASHLLQPLDDGCFAVLKHSYGRRVAEYTRLGIDSIEKDDFLDIFPAARNDSFKESIIQSAFAATGLVPLDPDRVLSKLNIRLQSPPLPDRPVSQGSTSGSNISTGIPQTTKQLEKRKSRLDSGLTSATHKISSPTRRDLQQFYNMSVKLVHEHILMRDEIKRLREGNRKQIKKREKSKKQIPNIGSLTELPDPTTNVGGEEGASVRYMSDPTPALEP